MVKKQLDEIIKEMASYGFERNLIQIAYKSVDGESDKIIDEILRLQEESSQYTTKPANANDEDAQMSKAIQMSIKEAKDKKISLQPLNPQQRLRKSGVPVGLKNVGNTCYCNSLLQTYFQNVQFVKTVLSFSTPQKYKKDKKPIHDQDAVQFKRKQSSCKLVQNMKILFGNMIASDRKYLDPTDVITSVVDQNGNQIPIGDQKDIGQFNLLFFARIDEGLQLSNKKSEQKKISHMDTNSTISVFGQQQKDVNISMLFRSNIKIQINSLINQQFFGSMENTYINQQYHIKETKQELFNLLIVNVKHKQLYRSLEEITLQHVDQYLCEKGKVGVQKQSWIKKAPKTLLFQINRVFFDKTTGQLQKINDQFDFPQIFYIDPFLLKNKDSALSFQKKVRKLRQDRQKYVNALKKFMKFGEKNLDLLDVFATTQLFFSQQQTTQSYSEDQMQNPNPMCFPKLKSSNLKQCVTTLKSYEQQIKKKIQKYNKKIKNIENEIQRQYQNIKSTPYHLYSILIHQGSADSGHYYSYTLDVKTGNWKKYNDINISDQAKQQVMKQGKGLNSTNAYYLIYSQKSVLMPTNISANLQLRNYEISSGNGYLKDYYSSMIPKDLKNTIAIQNQKLHIQIQQHKMGAYANRVVDSYVKKFETCNQTFRKIKQPKTEKKTKIPPPLLINLPLFFKFQNQDELYKSSLLYYSIKQYGPKQQNLIFTQILQKKLKTFNQFKKPKQLNTQLNIHIKNFMNNIYKAKSATKLFLAWKNQQYQGIFQLVKYLKFSDGSNQYFDWLANLFIKVLIVSLLTQAEQLTENHQEKNVIGKLKLAQVFCLNFINREKEKALINYCIIWIAQISIGLSSQFKNEAEKIMNVLQQPRSASVSEKDMFKNEKSNTVVDEIKSSTDIEDSLWNLGRSQNTEILELEKTKDAVKSKMEIYNQIYIEIKNKDISFTQDGRHQIMAKLKK